jgi:hypothetical protein
MKKAVALFISAIFLSSCDSGSVDQDYIESAKYQEFELKSRQEADKKDSQEKSFVALLEDLGNCRQTKADFPLIINHKEISSLLKVSERSCQQKLMADHFGFKIQLLKEISQPDYLLKLVLLEKESVYDDWRLLIVTFGNDTLINFKEAGIFQNNLSKNISTEIEFIKKGENLFINSEISRQIIYPVEHENVIIRQFVINSKGIIE